MRLVLRAMTVVCSPLGQSPGDCGVYEVMYTGGTKE